MRCTSRLAKVKVKFGHRSGAVSNSVEELHRTRQSRTRRSKFLFPSTEIYKGQRRGPVMVQKTARSRTTVAAAAFHARRYNEYALLKEADSRHAVLASNVHSETVFPRAPKSRRGGAPC
ncbi:hypothetical protein MRX96_012317 [Rhipicephalus microplus]